MTGPDDRIAPKLPEDLCRALLSDASVGIVLADDEGAILAANPAARGLLGDETLRAGAPLASALPQAGPGGPGECVRRVRTLGAPCIYHARAEGSEAGDPGRQLTVRIASRCPGSDGKSGLVAWLTDDTDLREDLDRRHQGEKMASLNTLAAGVAHHFNNILGGVGTFVDYALTAGDAVAMKRALQMTAEAVARASKITQSLLSFAERPPHTGDLADLTEVVLTFAHLVERPLAERGIVFQLDLQAVPILAVETHRMHQVLGNLLTNAEEAMPEGGTITLALDRTDEEVLVAFCDTGEGISGEQMEMVFEPFFTTKGLHAGGDKVNVGLGLSVVHGIVLEMGGTIRVDPTPGGGTTFTIALPIPRAG
jgi:signal transduction histidine kinase